MKEKQSDKQAVEEMAKVIEQSGMLDSYSRCEVVATELYNADYHKQSEGEWEQYGLCNPKCSLCHSYNIEKSRFCPNCGAKMKGGAE
jgi:hypothetical protein